jgi:hypothetical protein
MTFNREKLRLRFLQDPLPIRLGELAATFGRMSSSAQKSLNPVMIRDSLEEAKYFIEWTAADAEPEIAAELVSMQRLINLWLRVWEKTNQLKEQRTLLSVQAKHWSDLVLEFSGLAQ